MRVYLDTSVIGGCFDEKFREASRKLMECIQIGIYGAMVSQVLLDELMDAPQEVREVLDNFGPEDVIIIPTTPEVDELTDAYLLAKVVTPKYREDAAHIAHATVGGADVLVSWNFRHIVNLSRIEGFNAVNEKHGYPHIEIRSPEELIYGKET
ncbi:MAG: PIN domain protein [Candidatus Kapaibacterium sp.]